jgi:hypothetical protein
MADFNAENERLRAQEAQRKREAEAQRAEQQRTLRDFIEVMREENVRPLPVYCTKFKNVKRETGVFRKRHVDEQVFYYELLGDGWLLHENYRSTNSHYDEISHKGQAVVQQGDTTKLLEASRVAKVTSPAELHLRGVGELPVILLDNDGTVEGTNLEHLSRDAIRLIENGQ